MTEWVQAPAYAALPQRKNTFWLKCMTRRDRVLPVVALVLFALFYLVSYALSGQRPHDGLPGWWDWQDQSGYLREIRGFATGAVGRRYNASYFYPPLYALLTAPFWFLSHDHAPLIPDLVYFLVSTGTVLFVGRRFYGPVLPILVCAALFAFAPILSIQQWVIPWTSSLSSALFSVLILIYARTEGRAKGFRLASRRDWLLFGAFFVAFGALAPTRPMDEVVWFPFALVFFLRTAWSSIRNTGTAGRRWRTAFGVASCACACALLCGIAYLAYNYWSFGTLRGFYGLSVQKMGFYPQELLQKIFSLFWDSDSVFVEHGQAFFQKFPIFAPILAICIVSVALMLDVRGLIVLTALIHVLAYAPFSDLLPNGLFRYYNIHYFKWAYPWLAVIAAGQIVYWLRRSFGGHLKEGFACFGAAALVLALGCQLDIKPVQAAPVTDSRDLASKAIDIRLPRRRVVQFVDIHGLKGSFAELYFGDHKLTVDGQGISSHAFRVLPLEGGARLLLLARRPLSHLVFFPDPRVIIEPRPEPSVAASSAIVFKPLYRPTAAVAPLIPARNGIVDFTFGVGDDLHGVTPQQWHLPEPNGRWTGDRDGGIRFRLPPSPEGWVVSTVFAALAGPRHPLTRVNLVVNGCTLGQVRLAAGQSGEVQAAVPSHCLGRDGEMAVVWRSDIAASPLALGLGDDPRPLAVFVQDLKFEQLGALPRERWMGDSFALDFSTRSNASALDWSDWHPPEAWGRWSRRADALVQFILPPSTMDRIHLVSTSRPLIGRDRTGVKVTILANGCKIAEHTFHTSAPVDMAGDVPSRCVRPDGLWRLEWRVGSLAKPIDLGESKDGRDLGVSVSAFKMQQRPPLPPATKIWTTLQRWLGRPVTTP